MKKIIDDQSAKIEIQKVEIKSLKQQLGKQGAIIEYQDENLKEISTKVIGYSAKCFLHEWDHLQGITFKDRVSKLKWDIAKQKSRKIND